MRFLRAITAMLGAVAVGAVALPGQAAAAPTAPFTVLTVNGRHSQALDATNTRVDQGQTTGGGEYLAFVATPPGRSGGIRISSLPGTKITPGTHLTTKGPTTVRYGLNVTANDYVCDGSGSIVINSVTRTGAGAIDSISASYAACTAMSDPLDQVHGEFRWNAADGFIDATQVPVLNFAPTHFGRHSPSQSVTFTGAGSAPLQLGAVSFAGAAAASWSLDSNGCTGRTLAYGETCSVSVSSAPLTEGKVDAELRIADNSTRGFRSVALHGYGWPTAAGTFYPLFTNRMLDTRSGLGAPAGRLGPQQTLSLQLAGAWVLPSSGIAAVVLNVTVANATSGSFLSVFPSGTARPAVSNLNFAAGWVGANSVTVPVGANGKVDFYNEVGSVDVIADVTGYYFAEDLNPSGFGGQFQPHQTFRAADTRDPQWGGPLPGQASMRVLVDYDLPDGSPNQGVQALAVNITAVTPQGFGYLTAWNGNGSPPSASTLNFTAGAVVPNFAIVPTTQCVTAPGCIGLHEFSIFNGSAKATHVIVDVVGYFGYAQSRPGYRFHPLTPARIGDTRTQLGGPGTLGPNSTGLFATPAAARNELTGALVVNVTGVNRGGAATYLTAFAAGDPRPNASTVNLTPYDVRPNAAIVPLGSNDAYNVYNAASTADVIVDVAGRFDYFPYPLLPGASSTAAPPHAGPVYRYVTG